MPRKPICGNCSAGQLGTKKGDAYVIIDITGYDKLILGIIAAILLLVVVFCMYKCIVKYYTKYGTNVDRKGKQTKEDVESDSELNPIIVVNE